MPVADQGVMQCTLAASSPALASAWQDLANRSIAPSGFNAPEILIAALREPGPLLATVTDGDRLQLALPLSRGAYPLPVFSNAATSMSFPGMPHLGRDAAVPALAVLLLALKAPLILQSVPVGGGVWDVLAVLPGHRAVTARWERAMLAPVGGYEAWYDETFSAKRRKEHRRLSARLAEQGAVEFASFGPGADVANWARQFLKLEASGWKGEKGTALASDPTAPARFVEGLSALAESGKLRFWTLALDGAPLAMLYAVVEGNDAWLGKTAYDERWARYSPGTLLILRATEDFFAEGVAQVDSCAIPGHPLIERLWPQRLPVADVILAAPELSRHVFTATVVQEKLRRASRSVLRDTLQALTGRRRS